MEPPFVYKNEKTEAVNLFESSIKGIQFNSILQEAIVTVDWLEGEYVLIVLKNYSQIKLCFENCPEDERLSYLEISAFSYLKKNGKYLVQFDFDYCPLKGFIRFECDSFYFITPSFPIQKGKNSNRIKV